jgi:hypothetical protein
MSATFSAIKFLALSNNCDIFEFDIANIITNSYPIQQFYFIPKESRHKKSKDEKMVDTWRKRVARVTHAF